ESRGTIKSPSSETGWHGVVSEVCQRFEAMSFETMQCWQDVLCLLNPLVSPNYKTHSNYYITVTDVCQKCPIMEKQSASLIISELSWLDFKRLNWCEEVLVPGSIF
ncbi:hypothetical protein COCCADRAFT_104539, partial [Bipolaris zeicola 26-R-13]